MVGPICLLVFLAVTSLVSSGKTKCSRSGWCLYMHVVFSSQRDHSLKHLRIEPSALVCPTTSRVSPLIQSHRLAWTGVTPL